MTTRLCTWGATAILIAGLVTGAAAQNAPPAPVTGNAPPPSSKPAPPPKPNACIADGGGFKMQGRSPAFVITLENKCEKRVRCRVFANVTTARDSKRVRTTMTMAPHSKGAKAKQSRVVRVRVMGGTVQMSRDCRFM